MLIFWPTGTWVVLGVNLNSVAVNVTLVGSAAAGAAALGGGAEAFDSVERLVAPSSSGLRATAVTITLAPATSRCQAYRSNQLRFGNGASGVGGRSGPGSGLSTPGGRSRSAGISLLPRWEGL